MEKKISSSSNPQCDGFAPGDIALVVLLDEFQKKDPHPILQDRNIQGKIPRKGSLLAAPGRP